MDGQITGNLTGNVTGNVSGSSGSTTGNAATATALATARAIGGVNFDGSAAINLPGVNTSGNQDTSGNADTATALATARNIAGQSFDGTSAITIASTDLSNTSAIALLTASQTLTNKTLTSPVIADITSTADIDLTATNDVNIPANVGLTFGDDGEKIEGNGTNLTINSSGDVIIKLTGEQLILHDGTSNIGQFDLTSNNLTVEVLGNDKDMLFKGWTGASQFTALTLDMSAAGAATFNAGVTATTFSGSGASLTSLNGSNISSGTIAAARVATLNQDTSGNAATATALETARNIGGVSFDGSGNINLPGVNTSGNQNTSGNADTATTATNVTASANNSTSETVYLTFVDGATGTQGIETDTGLNYNPSTGVLTTTSVTGNLTGNVTGNVSGSSGSTTGNAATATALATARNIAGQSFDGTSAITIASTDLSNTSSITLNTSSQTLTNKTLTSPQINTQIDVLAQGQVRLQDTSGGQYVALRAPGTVTSNTILTLPDGAGTSGQVLSTNGSGTLSWADGGGGGSGSSYPNSTISTLPSSEGDYDLAKNAAQDTAETPFEAGGTDAFGVNLGTVFDMMDPIGATESTDLGSGEAYVGA